MTVFPVLQWVVSHGKKLWRTLRFPTLNISGHIATNDGTYKVRVCIDNQYFSGMGVYFADRNHCEVHCFGMTWDEWYGKPVMVVFLEKIRDNKKFTTIDQLVEQLHIDEKYSKANTWKVLTFWSFDLLHAWHLAYLHFAKLHGDFLISIVASDESIQHIKKHTPTYTQQERITQLEQSGVCDTVLAWHPTDFFSQLKTIRPNILVFGYDQSTQWVEDRYASSWLPSPFFVRAPSHQPDRFKSSLLKQAKEN